MEISQLIKKDKLLKLPLFSELDPDQLIQITSISCVSKYGKNEIIFKEGSEYKGFYIALKGSVRVYKKTSDSREITLHIIKPFNTFADVPLFEGKVYPVNAMAADDCTLLFFPGEKFKRLLTENSNICFKMLGGFAKRLRELTKKVEGLTLKEVSNRLAEYLVNEVIRIGSEKSQEPIIRLSISKKDLASYLGTITETLSRTFRKLEKENLIKVEGRKIFIRNLVRLKELSE